MAASALIYGCPISSYLALQTACAATNIPVCATATPASLYDGPCCSSLYTFGISLGSCYSKNAPTCLDTAAIASATVAATGTADNICAQYFGGAAGGTVVATTAKSTTAASAAATTTAASAGTTTGSAGTSAAAGTGSAATVAAGTTGSTAASVSPSASATKSGAERVGAGLKVYLGVAMVGALAVLTM